MCPTCKSLQHNAAAAMGPGTQIDRGYGRIVVDTRIGSGAMGVVFRGWLFHAPNGPRSREPPQAVALKQLKPQASMNPEIQALFLNEAEALSRLQHPNVVRFHDLFEWTPPPPTLKTTPLAAMDAAGVRSVRPQGRLTLAMELVEGDGLDDVIARNVARARLAGGHALPGLHFARAFSYFEQLLGALAAAHALGVIHRDVKPSNVMIRKDGVVKLADFGIAQLCDPRTGRSETSEFAPGTGAYMSPEQVQGIALDGRSDLYSAAILFYEMLTGRTPFPTLGRTELVVRMDQVETAPPPIRQFLPQAPRVLQAVFDRALAKHPDDRFPTAIELGDAFVQSLGLPPSRAWAAQSEMAQKAAAEEPRRPSTLPVPVEPVHTLVGMPRTPTR